MFKLLEPSLFEQLKRPPSVMFLRLSRYHERGLSSLSQVQARVRGTGTGNLARDPAKKTLTEIAAFHLTVSLTFWIGKLEVDGLDRHAPPLEGPGRPG